jgi:hypothetical protein
MMMSCLLNDKEARSEKIECLPNGTAGVEFHHAKDAGISWNELPVFASSHNQLLFCGSLQSSRRIQCKKDFILGGFQ